MAQFPTSCTDLQSAYEPSLTEHECRGPRCGSGANKGALALLLLHPPRGVLSLHGQAFTNP